MSSFILLLYLSHRAEAIECGANSIQISGDSCQCVSGWASETIDPSSCLIETCVQGIIQSGECNCNPGWTTESEQSGMIKIDCDVELQQHEFIDCGANSIANSEDECECAPGWASETMDFTSCNVQTCVEGIVLAGECVCDEGWATESEQSGMIKIECTVEIEQHEFDPDDDVNDAWWRAYLSDNNMVIAAIVVFILCVLIRYRRCFTCCPRFCCCPSRKDNYDVTNSESKLEKKVQELEMQLKVDQEVRKAEKKLKKKLRRKKDSLSNSSSDTESASEDASKRKREKRKRKKKKKAKMKTKDEKSRAKRKKRRDIESGEENIV